MNKILIGLVLIAILFSGCNEVERQNMMTCSEEQEKLEEENKNIIRANIVLEDSKEYYKDKWELTRQVQLNDLQAMKKGLDGYANCHIATTCYMNKDYAYEFFSCSELTKEQLEVYQNSCIFSEAYNEFYVHVERAEALK